MAVSRTTAWVDNTGIVDKAANVRLKAIRATINPAATATSFLQLFNGLTFTPGSDTPVLVIPLLAPTLVGNNRTVSVPFPHGMRFGTGLCSFVSTTYNGGTAATTHAPLAVDIHYVPGG